MIATSYTTNHVSSVTKLGTHQIRTRTYAFGARFLALFGLVELERVDIDITSRTQLRMSRKAVIVNCIVV